MNAAHVSVFLLFLFQLLKLSYLGGLLLNGRLGIHSVHHKKCHCHQPNKLIFGLELSKTDCTPLMLQLCLYSSVDHVDLPSHSLKKVLLSHVSMYLELMLIETRFK